MWKFALLAAAGLSVAANRRREREYPVSISGPMDGVAESKQQSIVALAGIGDGSALLGNEARQGVGRAMMVVLEGELSPRGVDLVTLAATAPCTAACIAEAKASLAGEILAVTVEPRAGARVLLLRRIRTRTGRTYASIETSVESDGYAPALATDLARLFPGGRVKLTEEEGGIAPALRRAPGNRPAIVPPPVREPAAPAARPRGEPFDSVRGSSTMAPRPPRAGSDVRARNAERSRIAALVKEVQAEVEAIRGIHVHAPLRVDVLDDDAFDDALRKTVRSGERSIGAARLAKWIAFGIAPNGADPEEVEQKARLGAGLLGFYDPITKKLYVKRDQDGASEGDRDHVLRRVVAHEIEHALQDQEFHLVDLLKIPDDETRLAYKALYEGEATAVERAWEAKKEGLPVRLAVSERAVRSQRLGREASLQANGYAGSVDTPLVLQEELLLQYVHGFSLVAEVLKNGDFKMVDEMFRNPPRTTAQVLDADLYFRGKMAAVVTAPEAPKGTRTVSTGSMGRLGTRVVMQVCGDPKMADSVSAGLLGDSYTVVEQKDGSLGVLWNTSWTRAEDATRFATMIEMQRPCWETSTLSAPRTGWRIGNEFSVHVNGTRATFARGFPAAELTALTMRGDAFQVTVVPDRPPALGGSGRVLKDEKATLTGMHFVDPRLSLRGDVDTNLVASLDEVGRELVVEDDEMYGEITFVPEPNTDVVRRRLFDSITTLAMRHMPSRVPLAMLGETPIRGLGRAAQQYVWSAGGGIAEMKLATVPICSGKAFIAVFRVYDRSGRKTADRFFDKLALEPDREPPVCSLLEGG